MPFAFDLVSISFPLTVLLNTATCLLGPAYVDNLGLVGLGYLAAAAAVYAANRERIDAL